MQGMRSSVGMGARVSSRTSSKFCACTGTGAAAGTTGAARRLGGGAAAIKAATTPSVRRRGTGRTMTVRCDTPVRRCGFMSSSDHTISSLSHGTGINGNGGNFTLDFFFILITKPFMREKLCCLLHLREVLIPTQPANWAGALYTHGVSISATMTSPVFLANVCHTFCNLFSNTESWVNRYLVVPSSAA